MNTEKGQRSTDDPGKDVSRAGCGDAKAVSVEEAQTSPSAIDADPPLRSASSGPLTDVLDICQAAALLRCSVDTLRRVDKRQLPVYRSLGRSNLYLRDDLIRFLRSRRLTRPDVDALVDEIGRNVIDS